MDALAAEVVPGLFVGSLSSLGLLQALRITHVVSVVNFKVDKDLAGLAGVLHLPLKDSEDSNLLRHLPEALTFIHAALAERQQDQQHQQQQQQQQQGQQKHGQEPPPERVEGPQASATALSSTSASSVDGSRPAAVARVLVHCQAGVSRSVAVAAAYLMRARKMGAQQAVDHIKRAHPAADPNEGFMAQLILFGDMRCSLNMEHPVYRMWCLEQVGMHREEQGWVDPDAFATLPGRQDADQASLEGATLYRCRKCRGLVATSRQVLPVEAAVGHRMFRAGPYGSTTRRLEEQRRGHPQQGGEEAGASLFVEPIAWMADTVVGALQGKLYCPGAGCNARLGSFNWSGISNERGQWVTPAFQLHLAKLDTMLPPRPLAALAPLGVPLFARRPSPATGAHAGPPPAAAAAAAAAAGAAHQGATPPAAAAAPCAAATAAAAQGAVPSAAGVQVGEGAAAARQQGEGCSGTGGSSSGTQQGTGSGAVGAAAAGCRGSSTLSLDRGVEGGQGRAGAAAEAAAAEAAEAECSGSRQTNGRGGGAAGCRTRWFTHLILDCDGVLVDTERSSCEALRRAILQVGIITTLQVTGLDIPHRFPADFCEVFGMDVRSCMEHYKRKFARDDWDAAALAVEVQAAKEPHYNELTAASGIPAFEGAADLIQRAVALGMKVGVGSSGSPEKIALNLRMSGLAPLINPSLIASAKFVAKGKPAPDVYLEAMRRMGGPADPLRALIVEDAVNGLHAAKAAGAFAVGVSNSLPAASLAPVADLVVAQLNEIDLAQLTWPAPSSQLAR